MDAVASYARSLHGSALTVARLMAAMPLGMVIGAFLLGRVATPSARIRMTGRLAVLSCAPLIGSAWNPLLWARAFGVGQSGLCVVQGLGILAGGALAQATGAPVAVGLAGSWA